MFQEVKDTLPISGDDYDAQIIMEIKACALDLTTSAEIQLPGTIAITRQQVQGVWTITDTSTLTDALCQRAVITYAAARFGNPPNYQQIKDSYDEQKAQLAHNKNYTVYGEAEEDAES